MGPFADSTRGVGVRVWGDGVGGGRGGVRGWRPNQTSIHPPVEDNGKQVVGANLGYWKGFSLQTTTAEMIRECVFMKSHRQEGSI